MKRLIFLCGFDNFYFGLATMTARTIRESGYEDDLIIFTTEAKASPFARCVDLSSHPESELVRPKGWKYFHKSLCTAFGHTEYILPYDYFMIKTLPGNIINRSLYDFILYLDSDILIHRNSSLDSIFEYQVPVSDFNSRPAARDMKRLKRHLTEHETHLANRVSGFGGGAFGIPSSYYHFFDIYRANYLRFLSEIRHDQPVLSFVKVRHHHELPFTQWPNRHYFRHYWGNKKGLMMKNYAKRYGKSDFAAIFPSLTLDD